MDIWFSFSCSWRLPLRHGRTSMLMRCILRVGRSLFVRCWYWWVLLLGLRNRSWGWDRTWIEVMGWMNGWYKWHWCMISVFLVIWRAQSKYLQSSRSNAVGSTEEIYDNIIFSEDESIRLWMHGSMGVWALDGRWILVDENNSCHINGNRKRRLDLGLVIYYFNFKDSYSSDVQIVNLLKSALEWIPIYSSSIKVNSWHSHSLFPHDFHIAPPPYSPSFASRLFCQPV